MKASPQAVRPISDIFNTAQQFAADTGNEATSEVLTKAEFAKLAKEQGAPGLANRAALNYEKDGKIVVAFNGSYKHESDNDLVATATHESLHSVGRLLDQPEAEGGKSFLQNEWSKLSPEQRRKASKQYGKDFDKLSDADLESSHAARHEWFTFQGFRMLKGEVSKAELTKEYGKDFATKIADFVDQFRKVLKKWVGTADVSTKDLDAAISNILGNYSPNATADVAEEATVKEGLTSDQWLQTPEGQQALSEATAQVLKETIDQGEINLKRKGLTASDKRTIKFHIDAAHNGKLIGWDEGRAEVIAKMKQPKGNATADVAQEATTEKSSVVKKPASKGNAPAKVEDDFKVHTIVSSKPISFEEFE